MALWVQSFHPHLWVGGPWGSCWKGRIHTHAGALLRGIVDRFGSLRFGSCFFHAVATLCSRKVFDKRPHQRVGQGEQEEDYDTRSDAFRGLLAVYPLAVWVAAVMAHQTISCLDMPRFRYYGDRRQLS